MNLDDLKKEIPFKWRVQSFNKKKPQATCVAYIDSRDVQDLLDDVCGARGWQCKFEEHKNNMFCSIGIFDVGSKEWVWKSDCGTESQVEKQKGEASDAFKRAAVMWGVGRFLYSKKMQYLKANEVKTNNNYPYVVDDNGSRVWDITTFINSGKQSILPEEALINSETLKELGSEFSKLSEGEQMKHKDLATKLKNRLK